MRIPLTGGSFIEFASPWFLLLLVLIPLLIFFERKFKHSGAIRFSSLQSLKGLQASGRVKMRLLLPYLRMLLFVFLVLALSRPRAGRSVEKSYTKGIDIMLVLDCSTSMLAEDFKPLNRIETAKQVAAEFVKGRENDRIGLVLFSAKAFTQCPLTVDYGMLLNLLSKARTGIIQDGTAIGVALANAVSRLRNSTAKSKVVILLTDGRNNTGEVDPLTAAKLAKTFGIRVYTIGMGIEGYALYPIEDPFLGKRYVQMPVEIDEELLQKIAMETGGKYFRATDTEKLRRIYKEINEMEKTKIEVQRFVQYKELAGVPMSLVLILLLGELILSNTYLKKLP